MVSKQKDVPTSFYFNIFVLDEEVKTTIWNKLQEEIKRTTETDEDSVHPWMDNFSNYYSAPQKVRCNILKLYCTPFFVVGI